MQKWMDWRKKILHFQKKKFPLKIGLQRISLNITK